MHILASLKKEKNGLILPLCNFFQAYQPNRVVNFHQPSCIPEKVVQVYLFFILFFRDGKKKKCLRLGVKSRIFCTGGKKKYSREESCLIVICLPTYTVRRDFDVAPRPHHSGTYYARSMMSDLWVRNIRRNFKKSK